MGLSHNAHTVTGGKGRKADHQTIIPLCAIHHRWYDEHLPPFDKMEARHVMKDYAGEVERLWLAFVARTAEDAA